MNAHITPISARPMILLTSHNSRKQTESSFSGISLHFIHFFSTLLSPSSTFSNQRLSLFQNPSTWGPIGFIGYSRWSLGVLMVHGYPCYFPWATVLSILSVRLSEDHGKSRHWKTICHLWPCIESCLRSAFTSPCGPFGKGNCKTIFFRSLFFSIFAVAFS